MRYIVPLLGAVLFFSMSSVEARKMTITQRQQSILVKIASAERSGELTKDEAISLRNEDAKIVEKMTVMKNKNGGKLSYEDINQIEKDMNKLSVKMHKKSLDKRVAE